MLLDIPAMRPESNDWHESVENSVHAIRHLRQAVELIDRRGVLSMSKD